MAGLGKAIGRSGLRQPERAQEAPLEVVRAHEVPDHAAGKEPERAQAVQGQPRGRRTEGGVAAAVGELEHLGQKLDVDQASSPELQVEAARALPPELQLHATAHAVDLGALGVGQPGVEYAPPVQPDESPGEARIPPHRPRLHQRLPLPEERLALEVAVEGGEGVGEGRRLPALPEAQVHPEGLPGAGDGREEPVEPIDDLVEIDVSGPFTGRGRGILRVQDHEIEIRAIVELPSAQLAHRDDQRRRGDRAPPRLRGRPGPDGGLASGGPGCGDPRLRPFPRERQAGLGQLREGASDPGGREAADQLSPRDPHLHGLLEEPQAIRRIQVKRGRSHEAGESPAQLRRSPLGREHARLGQLVEQLRSGDERLGQPLRPGEERQDIAEESRGSRQPGEVRRPGPGPGDEALESVEGRVGIGHGAERVQRGGQERGERGADRPGRRRQW